MQAVEIKTSKIYLISNLLLSLLVVLTSLYFLFFTKIFPEPVTKTAGAIANLILLYGVSWKLFGQLRTNPTEVLITQEKIGFYNKKNWEEISLASIRDFSFKQFYDRYKLRKQLILQLSTGEQKEIELNWLDTTQIELEKIINQYKDSL